MNAALMHKRRLLAAACAVAAASVLARGVPRAAATAQPKSPIQHSAATAQPTFGLSALNVNDARAYPCTNAFNYAQKPLQPIKMVTRPLSASARRIHLTPALRNDPS